jgi:2-haloacid dehalogenase
MKTIIFDFGSVIFNIDYSALYSKYFPSKKEFTYFRTQILTAEIRSSFNYGLALPKLEELAKKHPEYQTEIMATFHEYEKILAGVIPGMEELLQELSARGVAIYGLTNWSADNYVKLEHKYPNILAYMDGITVSGQEGIKKPDPNFFKILLDKYNIDPATAVFVDDKLANVETANSLGMDGVVFTSADKLISHLNSKYDLSI